MSKITQKNYEAIKIYRQKEKLFELKGKIQSLETENTKLKELLKEWLLFEKEENPNDFTIMSERMEELAKQTKEVLGDNNE